MLIKKKKNNNSNTYNYILIPKRKTKSYPTNGEKKTWFSRTDSGEAVSKPPVKEMLRDKGDQGQSHGCSQHVKNPRHVVNVQLT